MSSSLKLLLNLKKTTNYNLTLFYLSNSYFNYILLFDLVGIV